MARLLTEASPIQLEVPVTEVQSDAELAAAAMPYFANALGMAVPKRVESNCPRRGLPSLCCT